jgi:hypothetical protein
VLQTDFETVYDEAAFELIHIDTDNASASALHAHWDQYNPTFPVLTGCASIYGQYGDNYIPYNVVIDTEGILRYTDSGFNESAIHSIIDAYMSVDFPVFGIHEIELLNDANGDGRPDGGESIDISLSLRSVPIGLAGSDVSVTMTCDDPDVTITNHTVSFPDAQPGDIITGDALFSFDVAEGIAPHWATFTFTYSASYDGGSVEEELEHVQRMGRPALLLVDSDGGSDDNELFATNALESLDTEYDVWSGTVNTPVTTDELGRYSRVLWLGGLNQADVSAAEATALANFMDNGGQLILSSQYMSEAGHADFLANYFGVEVVDTDGGSIFVVDGVAGDPWFDATAFVCTGVDGANNNLDPDILGLVGDTGTVFANWRSGENPPAAVYVDNGVYKAMFMGFAVEATRVHTSVPGSMTMADFLGHAFDFFGETSVDAPVVAVADFRIEGAYPNPFNPTTTIDFAIEHSGLVSLVMYNTLGQEVKRIENGVMAAGAHASQLSADDLASGLYIVELLVDGQSRDTHKLMLLK